MLEAPDLQAKRLVTHLRDEYGLRVGALDFLPIGADVNTAVYRVSADDGSVTFLKLRRGPFDELSAAIPGFLSRQGVGHIIAPLATLAGHLWSRQEPWTVILYPFVRGLDGYERELSQQQWIEFGAALRRIHAASIPDDIRDRLPRETWSPHWREQVRATMAQLRAGTFDDPIAAQLAAFLLSNAATVQQLVDVAGRLARELQARPQELILCHADIHAGNLLITGEGLLYIVDWDTAVLAPRERDLMYPGSGLGPGWDADRATAWFYQGYGPAEVDEVGVAYYRCEREVEDIAAFCAQILSTTSGEQDRRQGLRYLMSSFQPGGVIDIALQKTC